MQPIHLGFKTFFIQPVLGGGDRQPSRTRPEKNSKKPRPDAGNPQSDTHGSSRALVGEAIRTTAAAAETRTSPSESSIIFSSWPRFAGSPISP
jgi:hypothetical protein